MHSVKRGVIHIAIDARMYGTAQRGIGRYLMKLIEALEDVSSLRDAASSLSDDMQYTIFLRKDNFEEYQPKNPHFHRALWDVAWYGLREQLQFKPLNTVNYELSTVNSIYHFPHWNVPLLFRRPFVVTIHDLELFSSNRTRENTTRSRIMYWLKHLAFRAVFRHAVLASRAVIVPSNVVREQLLDMYPQVRKKVKVIYEAPTLVNSSQTIVHSKIKTTDYELMTKNYILYVGAAYPHKNLPRLLEAWKLVHKKLPDYKLVLVGREDFFWKKLKQEWLHNPSQPPLTLRGGESTDNIPPLKVRGGRGSYESLGVIFYGPATDDELAALYKNAALLVQPSLEEGFSLPPLEALSFGTPVAVSDIPVHREILQNATAFFDPKDVQSIANTLCELLTNPNTRATLLRSAATLLPRYSWRTHAQQTLALYQNTSSQRA